MNRRKEDSFDDILSGLNVPFGDRIPPGIAGLVKMIRDVGEVAFRYRALAYAWFSAIEGQCDSMEELRLKDRVFADVERQKAVAREYLSADEIAERERLCDGIKADIARFKRYLKANEDKMK